MATVVILPGGFHPYHAGHYALYQSAQRAFPDADIYVAATDDRSTRPFPFKIKEKLATLAGVEPGHFVQVKSPFRADEITSQYNPKQDTLIFVRSTKDANQQPIPGGVKKDGKPAYLQPFKGAKKLQPFAKHAYMAYLPTVEFGPGITSASEIRAAWPGLDEKRKTAMVMSLYPKTQSNPKLAATVVKMLDTAIGSELDEDISRRGFLRGLGAAAVAGAAGSALAQSRPVDASREFQNMRQDDPRIAHNKDIAELTKLYYEQMVAQRGHPMDRREQNKWIEIARLKAEEKLSKYAPGRPAPQQQPSAGFPRQGSEYRRARDIDNFEESHTVGYIQEKEETKSHVEREVDKDPELRQAKIYAKQHYNKFTADPEEAWDKWVQRGLKHSEQNDVKHDKLINFLTDKIIRLEREIKQAQQEQPVSEDYLDEKWSEKYKRSIDCSHPKGFSQRAHCAGRKK